MVELLVVIAIMALLATLLFPSVKSAWQKAQSSACGTNLRGIGVAVNLAVTDNNGQYPEIDTAASPIYGPADGAKSLLDTLSPYGVTAKNLQCPVDMQSGSQSAYTLYGSSYEWAPTLDDESMAAPVLYTRGQVIPISSARVRLCTDFLSIHSGKMNALYADGHVRAR